MTTLINATPAGTNGRPGSPRPGARPQPSIRIPARPENRALLRRLRAAEAARWETVRETLPAEPGLGIPPRPTKPALRLPTARPAAPSSGQRPRLPRAVEEPPTENRWHALLALAAAIGIGMAVWTSGALAQNWDQYAAYVQRLVGSH